MAGKMGHLPSRRRAVSPDEWLTLYPGEIDFAVCKRLIGSDDVIRRIQATEDPRSIQQSFLDGLAGFVKMREQSCCIQRPAELYSASR